MANGAHYFNRKISQSANITSMHLATSPFSMTTTTGTTNKMNKTFDSKLNFEQRKSFFCLI